MQLQNIKTAHVRWPARSRLNREASGRAWFFFRNPGGLPICIKACPDLSGAKSRKSHFGVNVVLCLSATVNSAKQFYASSYPKPQGRKLRFVLNCKSERR